MLLSSILYSYIHTYIIYIYIYRYINIHIQIHTYVHVYVQIIYTHTYADPTFKGWLPICRGGANPSRLAERTCKAGWMGIFFWGLWWYRYHQTCDIWPCPKMGHQKLELGRGNTSGDFHGFLSYWGIHLDNNSCWFCNRFSAEYDGYHGLLHWSWLGHLLFDSLTGSIITRSDDMYRSQQQPQST